MAKILVIDDEPEICDIVCAALAADGHQPVAFPNGQGALAHVAGHCVDLVITDIFMPEVDGLQIIRETRLRYSQIPVIAISGIEFGGRDYLGIAGKFGAVASLKKPFTPAALCELVASLLAAAPSAP